MTVCPCMLWVVLDTYKWVAPVRPEKFLTCPHHSRPRGCSRTPRTHSEVALKDISILHGSTLVHRR